MPALYKAFSKALLRGNGYVFKELADRAYGRLKERVEIDKGPFADLSEEALQERIADLERKLGIPPQDKGDNVTFPVQLPPDSKPN